jgi:hypothetical protein
MKIQTALPLAIFALMASLVAVPAMAASSTLSFYGITHLNAGAEADGEASLAVEVIDLGTNLAGESQVRFLFTNDSSSYLTDVYFDDGTLLGISTISYSSGVSFSQGAQPPNLPGANLADPDFQVTRGFLADSDNPTTRNGVSQDEWLAIDFTLLEGKTFEDTLSALALPNGGGTGDLRIGVHVQGFASGGSSESFINNTSLMVPIPEPDTSMLLLAGLALTGLMARRYFV